MDLLLQIIGVLAAALLFIGAVVFFGIPGWFPPKRRPDKDTQAIPGLILAPIVMILIGTVIWVHFS